MLCFLSAQVRNIAELHRSEILQQSVISVCVCVCAQVRNGKKVSFFVRVHVCVCVCRLETLLECVMSLFCAQDRRLVRYVMFWILCAQV